MLSIIFLFTYSTIFKTRKLHIPILALMLGEEASIAMSTINVIIDASDMSKKDQETDSAEPPAAASVLVRLHSGYFTMCLSLCSQALLWKILSQQTDETNSGNSIVGCPHCLPSTAFILLWWLAFCALFLLSLLYCLRCIFHYQVVKAEFSNHAGLNYLFAPWISWLLLLQSVPFIIPKTISYQALCLPFVIPVIILDLKLFGQWFTTEKRFLSMVANPTSQMSVIGNMIAAWAAAEMGLKESAVCIFTVGAVHYLVVFITLYQRLSGADRFPAKLRPVFFLFVAAPSAASLAWSSISGTFNIACKMLFFLSLFLLISLACRPALFKKSMKRYNVGWWACSFPLTFIAQASAGYARQIKGVVAPAILLLLSAISVLVFFGLIIATALNSETLLAKSDPFLSFISDLPRTSRIQRTTFAENDDKNHQ